MTDGDNTGKTAASGFVLLARRGEGVSVFMFLGYGVVCERAGGRSRRCHLRVVAGAAFGFVRFFRGEEWRWANVTVASRDPTDRHGCPGRAGAGNTRTCGCGARWLLVSGRDRSQAEDQIRSRARPVIELWGNDSLYL